MEVSGGGGGPDKAAPVQVILNGFDGVGTLTGIDGHSVPVTAVCIRVRAGDHGEPGGGHQRRQPSGSHERVQQAVTGFNLGRNHAVELRQERGIDAASTSALDGVSN